ncbi:MAG: preprotein translocase subunit YajC [Pseudomonadota bacterium]|nr:preprotein translocase subunit YajC [Pseudomonadota bacterium]|tara:strand:- start:4217 stop:4531 length:315 start_codon:yes stop_codon:yes gene_type:complete
MILINNAYAQNPSAAEGGFSMILMILIFFLIMYFMIIRPQNKRAKEHKKLVDSLTNGTEVIVSSSLIGKITSMKEDIVDIEIAKGIIVKVKKNSITTILPKGTI